MTGKSPENVETINRGLYRRKKQKTRMKSYRKHIAIIPSSTSPADKLTKPLIMN